jgi:hypothetical protein
MIEPVLAGDMGLSMSELIESGRSPSNWGLRPVDASAGDLRWGPLFLLIFSLNIAVVMLVWFLVSLLG